MTPQTQTLKFSSIKQQFIYAHKFCESGIWQEHNEGQLFSASTCPQMTRSDSTARGLEQWDGGPISGQLLYQYVWCLNCEACIVDSGDLAPVCCSWQGGLKVVGLIIPTWQLVAFQRASVRVDNVKTVCLLYGLGLEFIQLYFMS